MDELLISYGNEVKALPDGRVSGYLVLFSTKDDPDISKMRDFFTAQTDYDIEAGAKSAVYYEHGLDATLQRRKLGRGTLELKDAGVWIEAQLELRDEYEQAVYELAKQGKLGWSSGTAPHLVERKKVAAAHEILTWPLGLDASLTPIPAEPRTSVQSLKSYRAELAAPVELKDLLADLARLQAEVKAGRRNAAADMEMINAIHRAAVDLGCSDCAGTKAETVDLPDALMHSRLSLQGLEIANL